MLKVSYYANGQTFSRSDEQLVTCSITPIPEHYDHKLVISKETQKPSALKSEKYEVRGDKSDKVYKSEYGMRHYQK